MTSTGLAVREQLQSFLDDWEPFEVVAEARPSPTLRLSALIGIHKETPTVDLMVNRHNPTYSLCTGPRLSTNSNPLTMAIDYDNPGKTVKSPSYLAHIVLRTNNLKPMVQFYKTFLGAHPSFENDFISFLTYDEEHHRIAILQAPGTGPKQQESCGLEHIAFTYSNLEDLALSYRQRKANGILPVWCINHGPTTSIYYQDPDGNQLETQIDNFNTNQEVEKFLTSEEFAQNPIGTDFDAEDLVKRIQAGEDHTSIKKRIEIGPRFTK